MPDDIRQHPLASNTPAPNIFGAGHDPSFPAPAEMLHVSIAHSGPGIDDMIRFYAVALNMRFVYKYSYPTFEFIALSHDDENHRIGILNDLTEGEDALALSQGVRPGELKIDPGGEEPRKAPLRRCRIEHVSWRYPSFTDVLQTARRVHDELDLWPRTSRLAGNDITIDYNDPDGNRLEILSQSRSKAQILHGLEKLFSRPLTDMKYSDVYQSFDMAKMLQLFDAGEPIEHLRDKAWVRQKVEEAVL